ncbi:Predicted metal-dependent enzyme of the double-stranded beta helix superfamily [Lentzea xinjiangensis]|uniref:Predicted metal-dependent enzyme of the double-stranded beta helix superfamily n=1 Tax=Lentzea xinjiangensis TaxID=402600 RepID=A0A1H9IXX6_9PSEU|nr:cysteine dioxygenase family protein [Lentzea xinjiangensis]SEQ79440.1 Predicted metal-dependent enzyme of the double-stranded beta helix superfamily [Lentzea xinjiangensis]
MTHSLLSPTATLLVSALRGAVAGGGDDAAVAARVAGTLAGHLTDPFLLSAAQREPDPTAYRQHVLHVEPDGSFSVVALVWLPGQETCVHDHVSWCVVGTYVGEEEETTYRLRGDRLVPLRVNRTPEGVASYLVPPGDIHKVCNNSSSLAISLHVYGADIGVLGTSIRRRYDLPVIGR